MILLNRRLYGVFRKELLHIRRDPRTLFLTLAFPATLMLLFGFGIRFDVKNLPLIVLDYDRSAFTREYTQSLLQNEAFEYKGHVLSYAELEKKLEKGQARVALVFWPGSGRKATRGQQVPVQVIVDGSDANTANIAIGYLKGFGQSYSQKLLESGQSRLPAGVNLQPLSIQPRIWYNPELRSANFVVPGIIGVIMIMLGALLTAFTIVEEKERGTIEMLIASPLTRLELILGKIMPYLIVSLIAISIIVLMGYLMFGVPIKGGLTALSISCVVYMFSILGIGVMISTITSKLQDALFAAVLGSMLPGILLSGFAFPIESMPAWIKPITYLVPTRYFLVIIRGIYLKGIGPLVLWRQGLPLVAFGLVMLALSSLRFRKSLD
jgi:ABC-2 type transport system permease protein